MDLFSLPPSFRSFETSLPEFRNFYEIDLAQLGSDRHPELINKQWLAGGWGNEVKFKVTSRKGVTFAELKGKSGQTEQ
jgi:hypothetical protein